MLPCDGEIMPFQSEAVANKFVQLAGAKGVEMTLMKLLKLVYFAHGWHLAVTDGKPLLNQHVEAWKFGPVAPPVYHAFKDHGAGPITTQCMIFDPSIENLLEAELITPTVPSSTQLDGFFDKIWNTYGGLSAYQLSQLTHQPDTPWHKVWFEMGGKDHKGTDIPDDLIQDYFKRKMAA
jgi:uncharacterized phage-associated protein